ncbi:condensation domain-containing protein [Kitasatospora sp. SC0581]|uniref:condensation domain-containing protein n=1 Tax=Kitasatospora sp. SC0581 TaxID=3394360 RepID=UPI003A89BC0D
MHVIDVDDYRPPPGRLFALTPTAAMLSAAARAPATGDPLSANEEFHLAAALQRPQARSWLACAFDLPFRADPAVLRDGLTTFARCHPTLRTGLRTGPDGRAERFAVPADAPGFTIAEVGGAQTPDGLRKRLTALLDRACRPLAWPSYAFAAVLREAGTTVVCGFDHCHTDAHSLAIAAEELTGILTAPTRPRGSRPAPAADRATRPTDSASEPGDPDRSRALEVWERFLADGDGDLPTFPLPLGTAPGGSAPPRHGDHRRLLDAAGTALLEQHCRQADGTLFTGLLAATALALRELGAPPPLRLLVPLHTRQRPQLARAIGWFTTVAPLTLDPAGAATLAAALPAARAAFRRSRETARLPLAATVTALEGRLRPTGGDLFMLSYLDYRTVGTIGEPPRARNPHHISRATAADTVQLWLSRTRHGLFVRTRHPGTATADRTVARFLHAVHQHLTEAIDDIPRTRQPMERPFTAPG